MHTEKLASDGGGGLRRWKSVLVAIGFSLLVNLSLSPTYAQQQQQGQNRTPNEGLLMIDSLRSLPKKLLAQGKNAQPSGPLKLTTYRIEEVALPKAVEVEVKGRNETVQNAILLTVRGGPFPVRALPPVIWIDDVAFEHVQESEDLRELSTVIYDSSVLREGANIFVSYGTDKALRAAVPGTLTFNRSFR